MKTAGTALLANRESGSWDDSGNYQSYIVGGDLLMLTGKEYSGRIEIVNIATGQSLWLWRDWVVKNTSLAFDARVLDA